MSPPPSVFYPISTGLPLGTSTRTIIETVKPLNDLSDLVPFWSKGVSACYVESIPRTEIRYFAALHHGFLSDALWKVNSRECSA